MGWWRLGTLLGQRCFIPAEGEQLDPCAHTAEPVLRRGRASCSPVASLRLSLNGPSVCCNMSVRARREMLIQGIGTHTNAQTKVCTHTHIHSSILFLESLKHNFTIQGFRFKFELFTLHVTTRHASLDLFTCNSSLCWRSIPECENKAQRSCY